MKPKISIITICKNSTATIERTIQSVITQNYDNFEYIIVDGGSTDGTLGIIEKYNTRISKWKSEPDYGISDAFNKGIGMCTGDIIGIINSDDGLMPDALRYVAEAFDNKSNVYIGRLLSINENTGEKHTGTGERPIKFSYYDDSHISHPSTFITKEAYEHYGLYDTNCKYGMDYELLLRMYKNGATFKKIDSVLAFFTSNGITFSKYSKEKYKESIYIIRKNGASIFDIAVFSSKRFVKNIALALLGRDRINKVKVKLGKLKSTK